MKDGIREKEEKYKKDMTKIHEKMKDKELKYKKEMKHMKSKTHKKHGDM